MLRRRAEYSLNKSGYLFEAFTCASLLNDMELAIKTLQKAELQDSKKAGLLQTFLEVASKKNSWHDFDFKPHLQSFMAAKNKKKKPEEQITKVILGFDEAPFNYYSVKLAKKDLVEHRFR